MKKRIQKQGLSMYSEVENLCSMYEALNWISSTGKKSRSDDTVIYFVGREKLHEANNELQKKRAIIEDLEPRFNNSCEFFLTISLAVHCSIDN